MESLKISGQPFIPGTADGLILASREPLSFWGGFDWRSGEIIDRRHPLSGEFAKGRILTIPFTRGSSTTTAVLLESIRAGTAPSAIITTTADFFFALAAVVADELYSQSIPLVSVDDAEFDLLRTGDLVHIELDGSITVNRQTIPQLQIKDIRRLE